MEQIKSQFQNLEAQHQQNKIEKIDLNCESVKLEIPNNFKLFAPSELIEIEEIKRNYCQQKASKKFLGADILNFELPQIYMGATNASSSDAALNMQSTRMLQQLQKHLHRLPKLKCSSRFSEIENKNIQADQKHDL